MMQCYDTVTPCEAPATPPLRRSRRSSWPPLVTPDIGCEARGLALVTPGGRHRIQSDSVSEVGPALHQHRVSQHKLLQMTLMAHHVTLWHTSDDESWPRGLRRLRTVWWPTPVWTASGALPASSSIITPRAAGAWSSSWLSSWSRSSYTASSSPMASSCPRLPGGSESLSLSQVRIILYQLLTSNISTPNY